MFPIETNAERPRPRGSAASSSARPRAPLCDEKPIEPGAALRAAKVAFRLGAADARPRQFGPMSRAPCARTAASSCSWRSRPACPTSAKPAEMTTSARTPARSASSAAGTTASAATAITARSTVSGISATDVYARTPATGSRAPVDRVGGAAEVAPEDVPEELAADRSASPGGPDHGDGARLEERPEGRDDGRVVPLVDVSAVALRRCDRELHLDRALLELAGELEAGGLEDAQHLAVVGHHFRDEPLDADLRGAGGEALEEPGADALALEVVRHREGRLGECGVAQPRVVRDRDDPLAVVLSERADEGASLLPVGVERRLDERPVQRRQPVEARVAARRRRGPRRTRGRLPVGCDRRPEPERAPVAEDDVDGRRSGSGHARDRPRRVNGSSSRRPCRP